MRKNPRRSPRGRWSDEQQDHAPESVPRLRGRRRGHGLTRRLRRDRGALSQTTLVKPHGADVSVEYHALVYDQDGKPWVFTVIGPRTYVRAPVGIKDVPEANLMVLSSGPPAGTEVVTVGAIELWGTELEIAGSH